MSDTSRARQWYDEKYHYGEDVEATQWTRIEKAVSLVPKGKITRWLDLGGGTGTATVAARKTGLLPASASSIVLDLSFQALATGKKTWPEIPGVQADGQMTPFADGTFDRIFCFGVLEHFPDVPAGAREVTRILKPDGRAVIIVPNWWVRTKQQDLMELCQSRRQWGELFKEAGLDVERVGTDRGPDILKNKSALGIAKRIAVRTAGFIPGLEYQFAFVLKKH